MWGGTKTTKYTHAKTTESKPKGLLFKMTRKASPRRPCLKPQPPPLPFSLPPCPVHPSTTNPYPPFPYPPPPPPPPSFSTFSFTTSPVSYIVPSPYKGFFHCPGVAQRASAKLDCGMTRMTESKLRCRPGTSGQRDRSAGVLGWGRRFMTGSGAGIMETDDRQVTTAFTITPLSALDKPSIMKCYHRRRTCSHTSPRRSPTMVTSHDTRFVECRCNTLKTLPCNQDYCSGFGERLSCHNHYRSDFCTCCKYYLSDFGVL